MPPKAPDHDLAQALLEAVQSGSFPQTEHVVAAELPNSALPQVLTLIDKAQEGLQVSHTRTEDGNEPLVLTMSGIGNGESDQQ